MSDYSNPIIFLGSLIFLAYITYVVIVYNKIKKHIKSYKNAFEGYFNLNLDTIEQDDFTEYLLKWDNSISQELKILLGEKREGGIIRDIILNDLRKDNYLFITLVNIFPAIGLTFTFLGLFFTLGTLDSKLFDDLISSTIFSNIISSLKHLTPVFLFGLFSISMYAIGLWIYSRLEKNQEQIANELNLIYHQFEEKYFPSKVFDLDEVYNKLLKPLNFTLNSLKKININFTNLSEQIAKYIEEIDKSSKDFLRNIGEIAIEILGKFEKESKEAIESISNKINEFSSQVNLIIGNTSNVINHLGTQSNAIISKFENSTKLFNEITEKLSDYNSKISLISEKISDFTLFVEQLIKFNNNFPTLQNEINKNTNELTKNFEVLSHNLIGIDNVLNKLDNNSNYFEKLMNKTESLILTLEKYDLEKLIYKITELEKENLKELVEIILKEIQEHSPKGVTTQTSGIPQMSDSIQKLNEISQELKEIKNELNNFSQLTKKDGKSTRASIRFLVNILYKLVEK